MQEPSAGQSTADAARFGPGGRLLLVRRLRLRGISEFSGYKKFTVAVHEIISPQ